jgi:DNA-binding NarL/FixJ family response regulator
MDGARADRFIALIETRTFWRERIRRSLQPAFSLPVIAYATLSELEGRLSDASVELVILSLMDANNEACAKTLTALLELVPTTPIIVLDSKNDPDLARTAISQGAKGYIPCAMGFEIAVEAARFVLE